MTRTVPSRATPVMLKWCRERVGLTLEEASRSLKIDVQRLEAWERGDGTPSLAQLRRIGRRYRHPTMVFYLPSPPTGFTVVQDFRRLPDSQRFISPQLQLAIRIAQERQAWAAEYLQETGAEKCKVIKTIAIDRSVRRAGENLRHLLGVSIESQLRWNSDSIAYGAWRTAVEAAGIFVFQTERISIDEMRGFALVDAYAPTVVINSQDNYRARVFTLIHEAVHILLGLSAISGGTLKDSGTNMPSKIERFCNAVAAEAVIPFDDFSGRLPADWLQNDDELIARLAALYHVSRQVIALRLVETGFATEAYLKAKWPLLQRKPKPREKKNTKIPVFRRVLARHGEAFVRLAMSAYEEGSLHGGNLFELMRIKMKHLPGVEKNLHPGRVHPSI